MGEFHSLGKPIPMETPGYARPVSRELPLEKLGSPVSRELPLERLGSKPAVSKEIPLENLGPKPAASKEMPLENLGSTPPPPMLKEVPLVKPSTPPISKEVPLVKPGSMPQLKGLSQVQGEIFEVVQCRELMESAQRILKGCDEVVEFVHAKRDAARATGVETIALEMIVIMEGERLERLMDALTEACETGTTTRFSSDGLTRIQRLESLLSEAGKAMGKKPVEKPAVKMGQAKSSSSDTLMIGGLAALGVAAVVLIIVAISGEKKTVRAQTGAQIGAPTVGADNPAASEVK